MPSCVGVRWMAGVELATCRVLHIECTTPVLTTVWVVSSQTFDFCFVLFICFVSFCFETRSYVAKAILTLTV